MEKEYSLAEVWDAYWTKRMTEADKHHFYMMWVSSAMFLSYRKLLRERNARRILLSGNGCSFLPHLLKHFGFDVIVVDISAVANGYIASKETLEAIDAYPKNSPFIMEEARAGGSLTLVTADIREWEPDAPIDAIYDDRTLPLLSESEWPEMAAKYHRWLSVDGLTVLRTNNLGGGMANPDSGTVIDLFESTFRKAGFQCEEPQEEGRGTTARISPHGKVVRFIHGSG